MLLALIGISALAAPCRGQESRGDWQNEVRKDADAHDWAAALRLVDAEIARAPEDMDVRAWRARILLWAGQFAEAEQQFNGIVQAVPNDPDGWMGLASVYLRERRPADALNAVDRAVALDPKRADIRMTRARILAAVGKPRMARVEFQQVLRLDPKSTTAREGLASLDGERKHELRIGAENDQFNFTTANHDQLVSLVSRWTSHWITSVAGNFYQIAGISAGKFTGGVTGTARRWGSLTFGGAVADDKAVVPRVEAFFAADRSWRIGENTLLRGMELNYRQHWYWYSTARILTLNEVALVYFPRDWTWSLGLTQVRSQFSGGPADWKPAGAAKLGFPIAGRNERRLSGNVFFAAGTEDFAQITQIRSFASQTYGGGIRVQLNSRQDVTGYASYQRRTQDRTDTNLGMSYGIRF